MLRTAGTGPDRPVIITPMASDPTLSWTNRSVLRPGREEPYLCLQDIVVFVRDLDRSLHFYVDQLGFELIADKRVTSDGVGWVEVAPPDGSADLAEPDGPDRLIGSVLAQEGRIDLLVCNAGAGWAGPIGDLPATKAAELLTVNLLAPIQLARLVAPAGFRPEAVWAWE